MNKKSLSLLAVPGLAFLVGFGVLRLTDSQPTARAQGASLTPKQREHAKQYKEFGGGTNLRELAAKQPGDVTVVNTPPVAFDFKNRPPFLTAIVCDADVVVVGVIKGRSQSQLTEDESFVFTDYEAAVEEVIKDNPAAPLHPGSAITISRPGGEITLNGKSVRALDESFRPFEMNQRYVFFLRFIPSTGGYRAFSNGSFQLHKGEVVRLGEGTFWGRVEREEAAFLATIHDALTGACPRAVKALQ
jgi:hypothetical protein